MILAPNGKPVASARKVALQVEILDTQAGAFNTERSALGFMLDVPDRVAVGQMLELVKRSVMRRLDEIKFFEVPVAPGAGGSPREEGGHVPVD